jgi:hypothetical protein
MKPRRPTKDVPAIPPETLKKLRALIRKSPWRTASSPRYRNAPHCYIIAFWFPDKDPAFDDKTPWKWVADLIREYGASRTWRGHRYKYLFVDDECLWVDWPALNRAKASTLD